MWTNTPGILDKTTVDCIFALILATEDNFVKKTSESHLAKDTFGVDVHHKKLGIIGMGKIGNLIAERAFREFDMDVL